MESAALFCGHPHISPAFDDACGTGEASAESSITSLLVNRFHKNGLALSFP